MKITIAGRGEVDLPDFNAGHFEDYEDEFNRILEGQGQGIPLGDNLGACITVAHAVLKDKLPGLTREELRAGLLGIPGVIALRSAVLEAFGLPKPEGKDKPGEGVSPAVST